MLDPMTNVFKEKWIVTSDPGGRPVWVVPAVNPSGSIKYLRVATSICPAILVTTFDERHMNPRLVDVALKQTLVDEGWSLLADLYREDAMPAGWTAYQKWMKSGPMMGQGASTAKPFPEKYLPTGIAERKAGKAEHQFVDDEIVIPEMA